MKIIVLIIMLLMFGCGELRDMSRAEDNGGYIIVVVDSCEYLKSPSYLMFWSYTHKGNCKFCEQRRVAREAIYK